MESDAEGFCYPKVDTVKCIDCGLCEKVCPILNKPTNSNIYETRVFAAINNNDEIRMKSSSGGMFTLIAEAILLQDGVVFGAAFSDDFKDVCHICIDNADDLEKLRGSKYVQSKVGDTYQQAKNYLENGRQVLFTGTACQIAGLYSYLGKPYDGLYTVDLICHGVPSPMVWKRYVETCESIASSKTKQMFFRNKKYGWKPYVILFKFENNTEYENILGKAPYMKAFLNDICLRPSCHSCLFKGIKRNADITIADFWGVENILPEMYDNKGTSLVMIHSSSGEKLFESIKDDLQYKDVETSVVSDYNPSAVRSWKPSKKREAFLKDITFKDFEKTVLKYTEPSRPRRLLGKIKRKLLE